jgi:hypothetical protein
MCLNVSILFDQRFQSAKQKHSSLRWLRWWRGNYDYDDVALDKNCDSQHWQRCSKSRSDTNYLINWWNSVHSTFEFEIRAQRHAHPLFRKGLCAQSRRPDYVVNEVPAPLVNFSARFLMFADPSALVRKKQKLSLLIINTYYFWLLFSSSARAKNRTWEQSLMIHIQGFSITATIFRHPRVAPPSHGRLHYCSIENKKTLQSRHFQSHPLHRQIQFF